MKYLLLDSGNQKKFEKFGPYKIIRPCAQALWKPMQKEWQADAVFEREQKNAWNGFLPVHWKVEHEGLCFKLSPTSFGHIGIFPEHSYLWNLAAARVKPGCEVLNLFAYSGGATLALAKAGASVCHVDAAKGMIHWAKENAVLNGLEKAPIRWIVDDALKFLKRELRRGRHYDGILLDPPSFGRGAKGEVFKIERDLGELLFLCKKLLSDDPLFLICSNHTNQVTPTVLKHLFEEILPKNIEAGELLIRGESCRPIPTGTFARWVK